MAGKNKTRLVGWHPSDPAAVEWLDVEIGRRGGRGAQSAILDEALEKAMNDTRLTDADLDLARRARELAGARDMAALRAVTGAGPETDPAMVCADALGAAQYLLGELAAVIDRLGGPVPDEPE